MRAKLKWFIYIITGILLLIVLAIGGVYIFRDSILTQVLEKAQTKFETKYQTKFKIGKAQFIGTDGIAIENLLLVPENQDTLISIQKLKTEISLFQLVTGDVQIKNLELQNGYIQLVKNEKGKNFDAFLKNDSDTNEPKTKRDYADFAYNLLTKILNLIPEQMNLDNVALRLNDMGKKVDFEMEKLELKNKQLKTQVFVSTNTFTQKWNVSGFTDSRAMKADVTITSNDSLPLQIPYVDQKFGVKSSFQKMHFQLNKVEKSFSELQIEGIASIENFTVNNRRIAKKDVQIQNATFNYNFVLGSDFISISDKSMAQLNKIKIKPYLEYNTEEDTIYKLKLDIDKTNAQDFIESLPKGLFSHFEGMQAQGDFDYNLDFEFNINKPYRLKFNSKFNNKNIKILKYGEANLAKLNTDFEYRAIENGMRQRPVFVGSSNSNYYPLDQISKYLTPSVLTFEDPTFFSHKGFIKEAFRQSIVKNIRTKKFARGGSTISMQLVKNVFLTREKTISRKLEEILLVYLLENNRIATKERMLEVYFNIIEWGPDVYGIGEASQFYFQKDPTQLTLNECLYLASIIPKPKKFMYNFTDEGIQKAHVEKRQKYMSKLLLGRTLITPEDTIGHMLPIKLTGRARSFLKLRIPQDTIQIDSLPVLDTEF